MQSCFQRLVFFSLLSSFKAPAICARHLITNMLIYLHSLQECQDRKGPCYLPLPTERLKMLHLALYGGCTAPAIASSYFKNSQLLELGSSGPNFSYKQVYLPKKCSIHSMAQFELVGIPLYLRCGYYFPHSQSTNTLAEPILFMPTINKISKKKSKYNFRVIAAGKSKVVSAVNFMLISVRI